MQPGLCRSTSSNTFFPHSRVKRSRSKPASKTFDFCVYALYPPVATLVVVTLITSIGAGPLNPIIAAIKFERIPPDKLGRVFGTITASAWIAMPLGMLLGGILTDRFGTFLMMIGLAITFLITTVSMAIIPAMKEMNRKFPVGNFS